MSIKDKVVDKHYKLSESLLNEIDEKGKTIPTQKERVEYYLKLGLINESQILEQKEIKSIVQRNSMDIGFIKKLLIQLFVNMGFQNNFKYNESESYNDFLKTLTKNKFDD